MFLAALALKFIPARLLEFSREWSLEQTAVIVLLSVAYFDNVLTWDNSSYALLFGKKWIIFTRCLFLFGALAAVPLRVKLLQILYTPPRVPQDHSHGVSLKTDRASVQKTSALLLVGVVLTQYLQLQCGAVMWPKYMLYLHVGFLFLNLLALLALDLFFFLLTRRWKTAFSINCALCMLWAIANYHVMAYHGDALFFSTMKSAPTALQVISGYRPIINVYLLEILAFTLIQARLIRTIGTLEKNSSFVLPVAARAPTLAAALGLDCALVAAVMFGAVKHSLLLSSVTGSIYEYGFAVCVLDDWKRMLFPFAVPQGYSVEKIVSALPAAPESAADPSPDIVLILNETFCDLSEYAAISTDQAYLDAFYGIENAVYGHAVVPGVGGGTNDTEFELLTACSTSLLNSAPFQYVDFTKMNNNLVQYLKRLGYLSAGMHCLSGIGYARNTAYPALGFDDVLLGENAAFTFGSYGKREWLDADNYQDLIRQYEAMDAASPRFIYLLTYQNHGGYEKNDAAYDTVHALERFGALTDDLNEYLTSLSSCAQAISELIGYFSTVDRPVIVCMTGDHAPNFITSLPGKMERGPEEEELALRVVPYLLWSNFGADFSRSTEYAATFTLPAEIMRAAGLPLTPYYQTILRMKETFPVYTKNGLFMDSSGGIGRYDAQDQRFEPITQYLYMEYNALKGGEEYREALFLPPASGEP